jgi:hypothetical protein
MMLYFYYLYVNTIFDHNSNNFTAFYWPQTPRMFIFYTAVLLSGRLEQVFHDVQTRSPVSVRKSDQSGDTALSKAMNPV